jgi:alcohol dehydrogenase
MYKLYCRLYQQSLKIATNFLPWRQPELLNSLGRLPDLIKTQHIDHVLIVTDKGILSLGLLDPLTKGLEEKEIKYTIYSDTVPNPTIENIEEALKLYHSRQCQGIIAFGGGSPMDCAKGVGARVARPNKSIPEMRGVLKVLKKLPPLFAIPTTAGTGSEGTLAAVVTNSKTHEKYALMDTALIPHYAVLDPQLTVKLPPAITAATGMDAMTHAVEAYIGRSSTNETKQYSIEAIKIIFENLYEAYSNGSNITAREQMQKAAYLAGLAFTRAYVGNIHAIAHTLGGFYATPHGLANAVILPYVLDYYGETIYRSLAELADAAGLSSGLQTQTVEQKAKKFIEAIKKLNRDMAIPEKLAGIKENDIPLMAERALKEANPLYPVPVIFNKQDMFQLYHMIKG